MIHERAAAVSYHLGWQSEVECSCGELFHGGGRTANLAREHAELLCDAHIAACKVDEEPSPTASTS